MYELRLKDPNEELETKTYEIQVRATADGRSQTSTIRLRVWSLEAVDERSKSTIFPLLDFTSFITRREKLQLNFAKLSFKINVSKYDRIWIREAIFNATIANFEQEFQENFISVEITSLFFLDKNPAINRGKRTRKAVNSTGITTNDTPIEIVFVVLQANIAQHANVDNEKIKTVEQRTKIQLEQNKFFHNITSTLKLVPSKSNNIKYLILQAILLLVAFLIAGFSIYFRWKIYNKEKTHRQNTSQPKQSSISKIELGGTELPIH